MGSDVTAKGVAILSILHFTLGLAVSEIIAQLQNAYRRIIYILLESGTSANETKYKNCWYLIQGAPPHASAIHCLTLPLELTSRAQVFKNAAREDPDRSTHGKSGKLFCDTIKAFLDPNAVDSRWCGRIGRTGQNPWVKILWMNQRMLN